MGAITSANVTVARSWETVDAAGCIREKVSDLVLTLSSTGGTAADIPASALGFGVIYHACAQKFIDGSSVLRGALVGVGLLGAEIFPVDVTVDTDANRSLRGSLTGTLYVRVFGTPYKGS